MRIILVLAAALSATSSALASRPVPVVAAENAYGDITQQIGGSSVSVTSILSDPRADPHLFEPGTSNALAVAKARLVIENGVGYDAFMGKLEAAAPNSHRRVVVIADVLGIRGTEANPHLWYDVPNLARIAAAIASGLAAIDPAHASAYEARRARFVNSLRPLRQTVDQVARRYKGARIAYTEPVPGYLTAAAGLTNVAPDGFTRAVEAGSEPTPQAVSAMEALVRQHKIRVLLYNSQAVTPVTARLREAALREHIPVVAVTETLPQHLSFQQWQLAQAQALYRALQK